MTYNWNDTEKVIEIEMQFVAYSFDPIQSEVLVANIIAFNSMITFIQTIKFQYQSIKKH